MKEIDKDKTLECFYKLHSIIRTFLKDDYAGEVLEAIILLTSNIILAKCAVVKTNIEQTMEETFDSIANYIYGLIEENNVGSE